MIPQPPHPFDGIAEKLKRAKENILNLDLEIRTFFERCEYPSLTDTDDKETLKAIEYHRKLVIPLRFSVLAGEVIHHLRSCFDHIVWHFSGRPSDVASSGFEFPVCLKEPREERDIRRFSGKIAGIKDWRVIALIKEIQPYNYTPNALDCPLLIIHRMDVFDKHRELVLCHAMASFESTGEVEARFVEYMRQNPDLTAAQVARKFKGQGKIVPQVAFRKFGTEESVLVLPGLTTLHNETIVLVKRFNDLVTM